MNEPATFRVWGWPSLGGWLTLLNGSYWVAVALLIQRAADAGIMDWIEVPLGLTAVFFSLPIACFFIMPGRPPLGDPLGAAIWLAVVLGLNAFAWGYGLAALIGGVRKWIAVLWPRGRASGDAANTSD